MRPKRPLPPTLLLIATVILVGVHLLLPIRVVLSPPVNLIGLVPLVVGIWLNLSADALLKRHETTVKPFVESNALVTSGVYAYSRHPMYVGFVLLLLGLALLLGSAGPLAVVLVAPLVLDRLYVRREEEMLRASFGEAWIQYERRVRKWI